MRTDKQINDFKPINKDGVSHKFFPGLIMIEDYVKIMNFSRIVLGNKIIIE